MKQEEKYKFRRYCKNYPKLFYREKERLKKILPNDSKIEHIGSTAVSGLGGKGIIDIIISAPKKDTQKYKRKLQKSGYFLNLSGGNRNRIFFERDYISGKRVRRVHLHLVKNNSEESKKPIIIRDYMRKNKQISKEYEKIKKIAVKLAKGEGKKYREYKKNFLDKLYKKALKSLK